MQRASCDAHSCLLVLVHSIPRVHGSCSRGTQSFWQSLSFVAYPDNVPECIWPTDK